jgi:hypothetical protein
MHVFTHIRPFVQCGSTSVVLARALHVAAIPSLPPVVVLARALFCASQLSASTLRSLIRDQGQEGISGIIPDRG